MIQILYLSNFLIILFILCFWSGSLCLTETQQMSLETYLASSWKDLQSIKCKVCKLTPCLRANHCSLCKVCLPKFDYHSLIFMKCIGARNAPLMLLFWAVNSLILSCMFLKILFGFRHILSDHLAALVLFLHFAIIYFYYAWSNLISEIKTMLLNLTYFERISYHHNPIFLDEKW